MPDKAVERWKQKGSLYFWRYLENTRNYPGWHLSAGNLFCQSFADLAEKMFLARWSSQKAFLITPPDIKVLRVANNRDGEARWESAQSLLLKYQKENVTTDYFLLEENKNKVVLSVGSQYLQLLQECICGISQGKHDYSIGNDNSQIWFW